jgi:hypothetical protein
MMVKQYLSDLAIWLSRQNLARLLFFYPRDLERRLEAEQERRSELLSLIKLFEQQVEVANSLKTEIESLKAQIGEKKRPEVTASSTTFENPRLKAIEESKRKELNKYLHKPGEDVKASPATTIAATIKEAHGK